MTLKARDVMQTGVITVDPEASLLDVHRLFVADEITGAPVVDDRGSVIGVITSFDLLRSVDEERDTVAVESRYYRDSLAASGPDGLGPPDEFQDRLAERAVSEVMTTGAISVDVEESVSQVARTICEHKIHRVLVTRGNELVGMITTFDLVGLLREAVEVKRRAAP